LLSALVAAEPGQACVIKAPVDTAASLGMTRLAASN